MSDSKAKPVSKKVLRLRGTFIKACKKQITFIGMVPPDDRRRWTIRYGDELAVELKYGVHPLMDEVFPCEDEADVESELTVAIAMAKDGVFDEELKACAAKLSQKRKKKKLQP